MIHRVLVSVMHKIDEPSAMFYEAVNKEMEHAIKDIEFEVKRHETVTYIYVRDKSFMVIDAVSSWDDGKQ